MIKVMTVLGGMVVLAGCAGSAEDTTASLSSAVSSDPATSASAIEADATDGGRRHHGPPPEAYTACESKAAGDACTITHDDQTISGTCESPPADAPDTRISCRPDHMPEGGPGGPGGEHRKPPEEAFTACTGLAVDAACTVTMDEQTVDGTCKAPPADADETRNACCPARPDGR